MTLIMGIVNVTADSFSDGGRYLQADAAIAHGLELKRAGADILDIGGESTRPGAERVDPQTERDRVVPVIRALVAECATVSIDTMNASTALAAVEAGAQIVNDVSGGLADPAMFSAVAETQAELIVCHWRGHSTDMYAQAEYRDVVAEVSAELSARVQAARSAGVAARRIIIDPNFGFAKHGDQNWAVLRGLDVFVGLGHRVLAGTSRKRFLAETLDSLGGEMTEARKDLATAVTSVLAAQAGAWAVRVHDVTATRDALTVLKKGERQ